jgi:ubiquinone/menaquinone biosynthesis C-methylase UbiE
LKRFGYYKDSVFIVSSLLYALNRCVIKPRTHEWFFQDYFNDLLLIPVVLPIVLWLQRRLKLRFHDEYPNIEEIMFHWCVWSILMEVIGPRFEPHAVGDPWDVVAYLIGGLVSWGIWFLEEGRRTNFDALSRHYRWMEAVAAGGKLQKCREEYLNEIYGCKNALLVGEGHGRFLEVFIRANPTASITFIDSSKGMIEVAKDRLQRKGLDERRVKFIHVDAMSQDFGENVFDLVVTNFFLDCFDESQLEVLISKLARSLKQGGQWMLADFCKPDKGWKRLRAVIIIKLMCVFFDIATQLRVNDLLSPDKILKKNGMQLLKRTRYEWDLLKADLWKKL